MSVDRLQIRGTVHTRLTGPDGRVKYESVVPNIVTRVGNEYYGERAAGVASPPAQATGMKLGTDDQTPTKSGVGAALVSYLDDSHQAIADGFPASALNGDARRISWRAVWAAGRATTVSPILEVVLVNDALADATSPESSTIARAVIDAPPKGAEDTLTVNWHHDLGG